MLYAYIAVVLARKPGMPTLHLTLHARMKGVPFSHHWPRAFPAVRGLYIDSCIPHPFVPGFSCFSQLVAVILLCSRVRPLFRAWLHLRLWHSHRQAAEVLIRRELSLAVATAFERVCYWQGPAFARREEMHRPLLWRGQLPWLWLVAYRTKSCVNVGHAWESQMWL